MLVGARPQDLSAAQNVSYDDSFVSCMCLGSLKSLFCTTPLELTLKTCLDKGIPLITLEVKFRMVYLL